MPFAFTLSFLHVIPATFVQSLRPGTDRLDMTADCRGTFTRTESRCGRRCPAGRSPRPRGASRLCSVVVGGGGMWLGWQSWVFLGVFGVSRWQSWVFQGVFAHFGWQP